jgi:hypothetical protein
VASCGGSALTGGIDASALEAGKTDAGGVQFQPTPGEDASITPETYLDGSVLCGLLTGPLDAGSPEGGPTRLCVPPEVCVPFNGNWACCILPGGAGGSICFGLPGDGGG